MNTIDQAIIETLKAHPDFTPHVSNIIFRSATGDDNLLEYTSRNGARKTMSEKTPDDIIKYILTELVRIYNAAAAFYYESPEMKAAKNNEERAQIFYSTFPDYNYCCTLIAELSNPNINSFLLYKTNNQKLLSAIELVTSTKFKRGLDWNSFIEYYGREMYPLPDGRKIDLNHKIENDYLLTRGYRDVKVNRRAFNKCADDILDGSQVRNASNEYSLNGTLFATQSRGRRKNQEDSVIILEHKDNPNFKFLAVADGMGGLNAGEEASNYTVKRMYEWFQSLPQEMYYYPDEVQKQFNLMINQVSNELYQKYNSLTGELRTGSTFTGAIITEEYTIISSVGDSRAYVTNNSQINLITQDESMIWPVNKKGNTITKEQLDDLRFDRNSNVILRCMGYENLGKIQSSIIPNNLYDKILIFSDGVTDLLSTEEIRFISTQTNAEAITNLIVNRAITQDAIRKYGEDPNHYGRISAGKDNATAAMYRRR